MRTRRLKSYIAKVADAEGVTSQYVFTTRSRRRAEHEAREWVRQCQWDATLVGITRAVDHRGARRASARRLLLVAGFTLALSGLTITAMMVIGLSLEGAL